MEILAIAGSLRAASINAGFCRAASRLAPSGVVVAVSQHHRTLPLFNPDLERDPPPAVAEFKSAVDRADALLIASPEYAHGISSVMKNALDWLVSHEGFIAKPVAVVNTSPRAHHAHDSLLEVLRTMSATLVHEASITLPLLGNCATEEAMVGTPAIAAQIRGVLGALGVFLRAGADQGPSFPIDSRERYGSS